MRKSPSPKQIALFYLAKVYGLSHILQAARAPVNLDEYKANAVAARIELDLRIGAAFTRLLTLNLKNSAPALNEKIISYGKSPFHLIFQFPSNLYRILSISHFRVRGRPIPSSKEVQAGKVLVNQGNASPRWD